MKPLPHVKKKTYFFGMLGEYVAILYLILKGYHILHHRYRTFCGEIDIIAIKKQHLVFVEVKLRKNLHSLGEIIQISQKKRIMRTAQYFLKCHSSTMYHTIRFDVVFISPWKLPLHFENIWEQ